MNEPPLSADDPRLTAYALGELDEPARTAVAEAVAADPALRAAVEDIRATARRLEAALAAEPEPVASSVVMLPRPRVRLVRFPTAYFLISGLAAACFALLVVLHEPRTRIAPAQAPKQYVVLPLAPAPLAETEDDGKVAAKTALPAVVVVPAQSSPAVAVSDSALVGGVLPLAGASKALAPPAPTVAAVRIDAATLAKYDRNHNGVLDPDEIAAMQADEAKADRTLVAAIPAPSPKNQVVTLNPFEVDASKDVGYYAENTLAGGRVNTNVGDLASSITVVTKQQLTDSGTLNANGAFPHEAADPARAFQAGGGGGRGVAGFGGGPLLAGSAGAGASSGPAAAGLRSQPPDDPFIAVANEPRSTFPVTADTAGYATVRRFIQAGRLPPRDTVRIEDLVNHFPYQYAPPADNVPFAATVEAAAAPWEPKHRLVRIGLKGRGAPPAGGTPMAIARDVSIEVEFNPAQAKAYRLIGYESPLPQKENTGKSKVAAGEIGAGRTVTALYEVIPAGADVPVPAVAADGLKYQGTGDGGQGTAAGGLKPQPAGQGADIGGELLTVKVRYREPAGNEAKKLEFPLTDRGADFAAASTDFKFAAAVAGFGLALREEPAKAASLAAVIPWAEAGLGDDPDGYRAEFIGLARRAQTLAQ